MKRWDARTYKQRGEWVELQFMAAAASHGYRVLSPWGDSMSYDVVVDQGGGFLRVQVKSTEVRLGNGYLCQFRHGCGKKRGYETGELDLFAAFVIPVGVWYLIPAVRVLEPTQKGALMLCPMVESKKRQERFKYEEYRQAWGVLGKSTRMLGHCRA
jgi:hypothetical protein